jgi:hypothetical protein
VQPSNASLIFLFRRPARPESGPDNILLVRLGFRRQQNVDRDIGRALQNHDPIPYFERFVDRVCNENGRLSVFFTSLTNSARSLRAVISSSAEKGSSQSRIFAFVANARAMDTR